MTDEELIKRLRFYGSRFHHEFGHNEAADRIEQLVKDRDLVLDKWSGALERRVILNKKLTKAVEALQTIAKKPLYDGLLLVWWIDSTVNRAKSTLAELEKSE